MMQTIKKYANRKLYHINRKQYITLEGIAELIQAGEQVEVIDNETSEDITATILAQVVLQARGRKASLPTHVLTSLIQTSGDTLAGLRRTVWTALGGTGTVDHEIGRRVQALLDQGKITADEAERMQRLLIDHTASEASEAHADVPSSSDVARLTAQVDALTAVVEQLLTEREREQA
jgi:polyhydroxyalkanoate synthesis repressor PhaR